MGNEEHRRPYARRERQRQRPCGPRRDRRSARGVPARPAWILEDACVADLEMPGNLVRTLEDDAPSAFRSWLGALPLIVEDLVERWSLDLGRPFQPGGSASWVAPVRNGAGERLVLKVGWRHHEALHEAEGLRAWDGEGAVRVHDALVVEESSVLLLEACEPGTPLARVLPTLEQDAVIAGLLRRLWIDPPAINPFRALQSMIQESVDQPHLRSVAITLAP